MMAMNCFNMIEINSVGQEVIETLNVDEDKDMEETAWKHISLAFKIELEKQMNVTEDLSPILLAIEMQVLIIRLTKPGRKWLEIPSTQIGTQEAQIASTCSALTQITCLVTALGTREGRMVVGEWGENLR